MRWLMVLYDGDCALCRHAKEWLKIQPSFVHLRFLQAGSDTARRMFPELDPDETRSTLTLVSDEGEVWRGDAAFLMALWALRGKRELALRFASPALRPLARAFFQKLSDLRKGPKWDPYLGKLATTRLETPA